LNAHGAFSLSELGVALTGKGREQINAFLPLYIHRSHWARVRVFIKATLGYFCTLDPLGFAESQFSVMYHILGTMLTRMTKDVTSHQLQLFYSLQRTCAALMRDFDQVADIKAKVLAFFTPTEGNILKVYKYTCLSNR
jgi:hypothetical protein